MALRAGDRTLSQRPPSLAASSHPAPTAALYQLIDRSRLRDRLAGKGRRNRHPYPSSVLRYGNGRADFFSAFDRDSSGYSHAREGVLSIGLLCRITLCRSAVGVLSYHISPRHRRQLQLPHWPAAATSRRQQPNAAHSPAVQQHWRPPSIIRAVSDAIAVLSRASSAKTTIFPAVPNRILKVLLHGFGEPDWTCSGPLIA